MEIDSNKLIPTAILYGIFMFCLWGLDFMGAWQLWHKITLSFIMLPICYIIAIWQVNK